jgi:ElaA protein
MVYLQEAQNRHMHKVVRLFNELTLAELYEILTLRQRVFVVEQQCPYQDCDGKDADCYHLFFRKDSGPILAYARIGPAGIIYPEVSIGRVVCAPEVRGQGMGRHVMQHAMNFIRHTYGKVPVRLGAQSYLINFYKSFGFTPLEDYLQDGIPHTVMLFTP